MAETDNAASSGDAPAKDIVSKTNAFRGLSWGQAVLKLRANPDLATEYDEIYDKDPEQVDAWTRLELSGKYAHYRGSVGGAVTLTALANVAADPKDARDTYNAQMTGAMRIAAKYRRPDQPLPLTGDEIVAGYQKEYEQIVGDLARYESMAESKGLLDYGAAIAGTLAGTVTSPETLLSWPVRGANLLARMGWAGFQGAIVNTATDPIVQGLNIYGSGEQKKYDWLQTLVMSPTIGAIAGGGIYGGGEVIARGVMKVFQSRLAVDDPSFLRMGEALAETDVVASPKAQAVEPDAVKPGIPDDPGPARPDVETFETFVRRNVATYDPKVPLAEQPPEVQKMAAEWVERTGEAPKVEVGGEGAIAGAEAPTAPAPKVEAAPPEALGIVDVDGTPMLVRNSSIPETLANLPPTTAGRAPGTLRGEPTPAPIPNARPPETVATLQQMSRALEAKFGIAIRQGKPGVKGALGTFNTRTGVIRVLEAPDFAVNIHEVAHHIHFKEGFQRYNNFNDNPQWAHELASMDYDQGPLGRRTFEGFAEFIRYFVTNPAYAQRHAPNYFANFATYMEANQPKALEALINFQRAYQNYLTATPEQIVMQGIVTPTTSWLDTIASVFTGEKIAPTNKSVMALAYDGFIDQRADVGRFVDRLTAEYKAGTGKLFPAINPGHDPRLLDKAWQNSGQSATRQLVDGIYTFGTTTPSGPSFVYALSHAMGTPNIFAKWDSDLRLKFDAYLSSRVMVHRWDQYAVGDIPNPPSPHSKAYHEKVIATFDAEHPTFRSASDEVHAFSRAGLQRDLDAGLISVGQFDNFSQLPFYVPENRDVHDLIGKGGRLTKSGEGSGAPGDYIHSFEGSQRDVISPITSIINQVNRREYEIARKEFINAIGDLGKAAGIYGGKYFEPLPAHEVRVYTDKLRNVLIDVLKKNGRGANSARAHADDILNNHFTTDEIEAAIYKMEPSNRNEPIVFWRDGGELKAARVATRDDVGIDLYGMVKSVPKPAQDVGLAVLRQMSHLLTSGVVTHPIYAMRNLVRDQWAAGLYVPGYVPGVSPMMFMAGAGMDRLRGLPSRRQETMRAYEALGGTASGQQYIARAQATEADIQSMTREGYKVTLFTSPMEGLRYLTSIGEQLTRHSVMYKVAQQKMKQGLNEYDAMRAGMGEASSLLDFDRNGGVMQSINAATPFFRPWLLGLDKAADATVGNIRRAINPTIEGQREEAIKKLAWLGAVGIAGEIGLGFLHSVMQTGNQAYDNADPKTIANSVIFTIGDRVLLIPKPFELSIPFTAGEYMAKAFLRDDPKNWHKFAESAFEAVQGPFPFINNPAIKASFEVRANYNTFTGAPIVPKDLQKVDNAEQFTPRTSAISKGIADGARLASGGLVDMSPMKVDHIFNSVLGMWGKDLTTITQGDAQDGTVANFIDNTLLRAVLKSPMQVASSRQEFWKLIGETNGTFAQSAATYDKLLKDRLNPQRARDYYNKMPENIKAWTVLTKAGTEDGKLAFSADERKTHPLSRGATAVGQLTNIQREMEAKQLYNRDGEPVVVDPDTRKRLSKSFEQMKLAEMVNALAIVKQPGYTGRPLFDMDLYLETIEGFSPGVANVIRERYAQEKIYKTTAVASAYEPMAKELVRGGSSADISILSGDVRDAGYEFGGDRRPRPRVKRPAIEERK